MRGISVIVPIYNAEKDLKSCLLSIEGQSYKDLELILVDDGSEDKSAIICKEWVAEHENVRYIYQEHAGAAVARLRGIAAAGRDYIIFVDADDTVSENICASLMTHSGGADMVSCGYFISYEGSEEKREIRDNIEEGLYQGEKMEYVWENMMYFGNNRKHLHGILSNVCNKLFKSDLLREVAEELKGNNYYKNINFGEDSVLLYRYLLKCRAVYVLHESFYYYKMREHSLTHIADKKFLYVINDYYLALLEAYESHCCSHLLIPQLEETVCAFMEKFAPSRMGFGIASRRCSYKLPEIPELYGKKTLLYGAGYIGKDYMSQIKNEKNYDVRLWIDKAYKLYEDLGVVGIEALEDGGNEVDAALIAVKDRETAASIAEELKTHGIPEDSIYWEEAERISEI